MTDRKKREAIAFVFDGIEWNSLAQFAAHYGIKHQTVYARWASGIRGRGLLAPVMQRTVKNTQGETP